MRNPRAYTYVSMVFFLAAVVFMLTGNNGTGAAFIAIGAVFIALGQTPPKNDKDGRTGSPDDGAGPQGEGPDPRNDENTRPPSA